MLFGEFKEIVGGNYLPCPFCGCDKVEHYISVDHDEVITCTGCRSRGAWGDTMGTENGKTAFEKWNTRWNPVEGE